MAARTSFTSRTPVVPTLKSSCCAPTFSAAAERGASEREIMRLARRATRAVAATLPAQPAASMRFWGLGRLSASSREMNCGRYSQRSTQTVPSASATVP
ncbi:hypothetical protein [Candidatus Collinsella stercoripullorum]|uniref:hypothetical protein n=1 Tax=Candidatus Collinsella stercoripullorum TaxID=2838522 RepID=UPI003A4E187D